MDRHDHYQNYTNITNSEVNDNNITRDENISNDTDISNDKKSFLQRLGEANVMPDGMLSAIDDTDRVILAMEEGARIEQENNR